MCNRHSESEAEAEVLEESLATLDKRFESVEGKQYEAAETIGERERLKLSEDRSKIARWVVLLFISASLGTLFFVGVSAMFAVAEPQSDGEPRWIQAAGQMVTILSSIILPIVTLVIGYYFGSETKQE